MKLQTKEVKTSEEQYKTNYNNNNIGSVWNGSTGEASVDNDIFNYIDMNTYKLIEIESTIPKEAQEFLKIY